MNPTEDYTNTHLVAIGATMSPLWLHSLSDTAQMILPIVGVLWLLIQAGGYLYKTLWKKDKHDEPSNPS